MKILRPCYNNETPKHPFCAAQRDNQCYGRLYEVCRYKVTTPIKPQFHCVFCGEHGDYAHFDLDVPSVPHKVFACPKCREYKGLEACDKTDVRKCSLE